MPSWVLLSVLAWLGQAPINQSGTLQIGPPVHAAAWKLSASTSSEAGHSITTTADLSQSDIAFAGVMIRCTREKATLAVVAITPFAPKAQVQVTVKAKTESRYVGSVSPGGAAVELPDAALNEAIATWPAQGKISLLLETDRERIRGVVDVAGFASAYENLRSACSR